MTDKNDGWRLIDLEMQKIWDQRQNLTGDDLLIIRQGMINYALAAMMDSAVREEIDQICKEQQS